MKIKKRYALSLLIALLVASVIAFRYFRRPDTNGPSPDEMVVLLLEYDKNGDGQLHQDEVPERMHGLFTRGDANQDGVLTREELRKLAEADSEAARRKQRNERR